MSNVIKLVRSRDEYRVDSRVIAERIGVRHKNTMALIDRHAEHFARFGHLPFQTEVGKRVQGGGKAERFALLGEDQAYFLLTLTRNTARVVDLKANLVMAFRDARNQAGLDSMMGMVLLTAPAPWEKRFDDDYYQALARITRTTFSGHAGGTPAIYGQITDRWVYGAILPREIHAELKARRGDSERMHQWLTDGGRDRLEQQIKMVALIAETSADLKDFEARCMQRFGVPGQLSLAYPMAS